MSKREPGTRRAASRRARISVVIPVLNESKTIGDVVTFARRSPLVGEVLVIDDGSHDGTPELAAAKGARVVMSSMLGKGASMEDGLLAARHEFVIFLDGDLHGLAAGVIRKLAAPLLTDRADFVKASFARAAGRVTMLTAKPLLKTYFPEVAHLHQPLSGIFAVRRSLLAKLRFENDYGVDIGLLLDATALGARIAEVDIGRLEHDSQSLEALGEMAAQVARTIIDRAAELGRLQPSFIRASREKDRRIRAIALDRVVNVAQRGDKLALLDMDGTVLDGRFVTALAECTGRSDRLAQILDSPTLPAKERTRRIGMVFRGVPQRTFEDVARAIPLQPGAGELVIGLHRRGYVVGLLTDSCRVAATIVRRRIFADFAIANVMSFHDGVATGRVMLAPAMRRKGGCPRHAACKVNVLANLSDRLPLPARSVLAIGDNENDVCMLRSAGRSFAFQPKTAAVAAAADRTLRRSLAEALRHLPPP